ncbi:MAG: hypothetical protein VXW49_06710, partial [Pseudomonadota bacterium]|nr:hypothetical protein [Pseudomonadota bacterium]
MPILDKLAVVLIETRETALTGFSAQERDDLIETLLRIKVNLADADEADTIAAEQPQAAIGAAD